jgi:hypothetical protein
VADNAITPLIYVRCVNIRPNRASLQFGYQHHSLKAVVNCS